MEQVLKELLELKRLAVLGAKQVLTMSDAALLTGLSKSHLYKLVCAKQIPYYKSQGGKLTYFDKSEVEAWCKYCRTKTICETEAEAMAYLVGKRRKLT